VKGGYEMLLLYLLFSLAVRITAATMAKRQSGFRRYLGQGRQGTHAGFRAITVTSAGVKRDYDGVVVALGAFTLTCAARDLVDWTSVPLAAAHCFRVEKNRGNRRHEIAPPDASRLPALKEKRNG
jgi:hypothetical protein